MKDQIFDELLMLFRASLTPMVVALGLVFYHYTNSYGFFVGWGLVSFLFDYLKYRKEFYGRRYS